MCTVELMDEGSIWRTCHRYVPSAAVELGHHMERWLTAIKAQHTALVRGYVWAYGGSCWVATGTFSVEHVSSDHLKTLFIRSKNIKSLRMKILADRANGC